MVKCLPMVAQPQTKTVRNVGDLGANGVLHQSILLTPGRLKPGRSKYLTAIPNIAMVGMSLEHMIAGVPNIWKACPMFQDMRAYSIQTGAQCATAPAERAGPADTVVESISAWIESVPTEGRGGRSMSCQVGAIIGKSPGRQTLCMKRNTAIEI